MKFASGLISPWYAFEAIPGQAAVEVVWRSRMGNAFDALISSCLQHSSEMAEYVPCLHDCGCAHEVVRNGDSDIVAVCCCNPPNCEDLVLSLRDLVVWRLDWNRLGKQVCAAFELSPRAADIGVPRTRQVGAWSAASVPVLLGIHVSSESFRAATAELVSRLKRTFILLTPTGQFVDAFCEELFAHCGAAWFSLEASTIFDAWGILRARIAPGKLFSPFQPAVDDSRSEVAAQALQLLVRLDSELRLKPPSLVTVFKLSCRDGLSAEKIARKCGCSKATVINRQRLLQEKTGLSPTQMRQVSSHLDDALETANDSRASRLYRRSLIEESDEEKD